MIRRYDTWLRQTVAAPSQNLQHTLARAHLTAFENMSNTFSL